MSNSLPLLIESLVSILLLLTIGYCILLNKRLQRLKSDEQSLKATISELITVTEIAERAVAGLKVTVRDCDRTLGERLRTAERFVADIDRQVVAGEQVLQRLSQIAAAAGTGPEAAPPAPDPTAVVKAAQAFADRARLRANGRAA
ncbi:MAG: DUF6468 domain-containing protein [Xanthobacteraceae bacterium]